MFLPSSLASIEIHWTFWLFWFLFLGSSPRVSDNILCHDQLHDNTYMSLVGMDIPLHNVLVVGSFGTLLVLCLVQILLFLILHLYIHLDLLMAHCTEVHIYIAGGYTEAAHYYILVVQCCTAALHYFLVVVPG
jgi:hypothetical protein